MKIISKFLFIGLSISIIACNQNSSGGKSTTAENKEAQAQLKNSDENPAAAPFEEGKISIQITTPGSAFGELMQQVDPAKGDFRNQMKALATKLSAKDRTILEAQNKKAGMTNLAILMLPLRSVMYIKGTEATAKFDALTYHGENNVDESKKAGMLYMKSQNSDKAMTISYTGDSFKDMASNQLKASDYDIVKTSEQSTVAGYSCSKSIYTLKNAMAPKRSETGLPGNGSIYRLEVWTSKQMPKSVNFLHPLYISEDAGIMKILVQYEKASELKFLYEFIKVENRPVTPAEMAIKKTEKVYDFGKEKMTAGMQMMGIIFGM